MFGFQFSVRHYVLLHAIFALIACGNTEDNPATESLPPLNSALIPQAQGTPDLCLAPNYGQAVQFSSAQHPDRRLQTLVELFSGAQGQTYGIWLGANETYTSAAVWVSERLEMRWAQATKILETRYLLPTTKLVQTATQTLLFYAEEEPLSSPSSGVKKSIKYLRRTSTGTWEQPVTLTSLQANYLIGPFVETGPAGHVIVGWRAPTVLGIVVADPQLKWTKTETHATNGNVGSPHFSINSQGRALAAWTEDPDGDDDFIYTRFYDPKTGWSALITGFNGTPNTLGNNYYSSNNPSVFVDLQEDGTANLMFMNRLRLFDETNTFVGNNHQLNVRATTFGQPWNATPVIVADSLEANSGGMRYWEMRGTKKGELLTFLIFAENSIPRLFTRYRTADKVWQTPQLVWGTPEDITRFPNPFLTPIEFNALSGGNMLMLYRGASNAQRDGFLQAILVDSLGKIQRFENPLYYNELINQVYTETCRSQVQILFDPHATS